VGKAKIFFCFFFPGDIIAPESQYYCVAISVLLTFGISSTALPLAVVLRFWGSSLSLSSIKMKKRAFYFVFSPI